MLEADRARGAVDVAALRRHAAARFRALRRGAAPARVVVRTEGDHISTRTVAGRAGSEPDDRPT